MSRREKVFEKLNKITDNILTVFFILVILVGVYLVLDTYYVYMSVSADSVGRFKPDAINEETLREISGDAVAWITIDDTTIDYPIMQTDNNTDYLNKDPKGQYSLAGSIFMDSRCASDFSDHYSLVYGHHMAQGLMFGALDDFGDMEYMKTHQTGTLYTKKEEIPFKVVAFVITKTDCDEIFNTDIGPYGDFLQNNASVFLKENMGDHLMSLTTCKDPATTDRTALIISLAK